MKAKIVNRLKKMNIIQWIMFFVLLISISSSTFFSLVNYRLQREKLVAYEINYVKTIAISLSCHELLELSAVEEDINTPQYASLQNRLVKHKGEKSNIAFIYVFDIIDDQMVFMVEAEPIDSPNFSPPGSVYEYATQEQIQNYIDNETVFESEFTDSYGTFVSIITKIYDLDTNELIGYLGVDHYADTFYESANLLALQFAIIMFFGVIIIIVLYLTVNSFQNLKIKQHEFDLLISQMPQGFALHEMIYDENKQPSNYKYISVNKSFENMTGLKNEKIVGKSILELLPNTEKFWIEKYGEVAKTQIPMKMSNYSSELNRYYNVVAYSTKKNTFAVVVDDVTDDKLKDKKILENSREYETIVNSLPVGLIIFNDKGEVEIANQKAAEILDTQIAELQKNFRCDMLGNCIDSQGEKLKPEEYPIEQVLATNRPVQNFIAGVEKQNGKITWLSISATPLNLTEGVVSKVIVNLLDITNETNKQQQIRYLSEHDFLTGLYNRRHYDQMLTQMDKPEFYPLTIMYIDVNGLKIFNDAYGHQAGDESIRAVAKVMGSTFNSQDILSRVGGDEFAVILPNCSQNDAEELKQKFLKQIEKQTIRNIQLSVSIGYETKYDKDTNIEDVQKTAEKIMYHKKVANFLEVRRNAVEAIFNTLTSKFNSEEVHSNNVANLSAKLAEKLQLGTETVKEVFLAGKYHDIGKISIPDSILLKPDKLTDEEYETIKTHTQVGYQILKAADEYTYLAESALYHHEKWDGSGYPKGLQGENIPLYARIVAICDSFDAMTSERVYKKAITKEDAAQEILKNSGTQFDPTLVKIFLDHVINYNAENL